jgi:uncharacterized membrane protein HdeD (DUF308 family)
MTANAQNRAAVSLMAEVTGIGKIWGWFLALGIVQIIAGIMGVGFVSSAALATVVTLGLLLLIAGCAQTAAALLARDWDGFYLFLLLAFLYGVAGFLTLEHPRSAAEGLPLMLAALFLLVGLYRIAVALVDHLQSRGWLLVNGVVTALLGLAIWRQWPKSGLSALGVLVGIELIVNGATWSVLAVAHRPRISCATMKTRRR